MIPIRKFRGNQNQIVDLLSNPREQQNILISRIFLGFGGGLLLLTRVFSLFDNYTPFANIILFGIPCFCFVVLLVSYLSKRVERYIHVIAILVVYFYSSYIYVRLGSIEFPITYILGLAVFLFTSSFIFNRFHHLFLFVLFNIVLFFIALAYVGGVVDRDVVYFYVFIIVSVLLLSYLNIKRIENLEERSFHFNTVFEHLNDGVMIVDRQQKIQFVNHRMTEIVGYEKSSLVKQNAKIMLAGNGFDDKLDEENESRRLGRGNKFEIKLRRGDNTIIDVEISGSPIYDQAGNLVGSIGIHKDITHQKKSDAAQKAYAEDITKLNRELLNTVSELEESNHELERFAFATSHDLKSPLRSISGFARIIQRRYSNKIDEEVDDYINLILDGCRDMNDLIDGLLNYSKAENKELTVEDVNTSEVLQSVVNLLVQPIQEANAQIIIEENLPVIKGNKIQIQQVFQNLIMNAIKYKGVEDPIVSIYYEDDLSDKTIHYFKVVDNGKGIPADQFDNIFTLFKRLENQSISGSGIGLSICRRVIQNHGGDIWVTSEIGKGSTFHFTIAKDISKTMNEAI